MPVLPAGEGGFPSPSGRRWREAPDEGGRQWRAVASAVNESSSTRLIVLAMGFEDGLVRWPRPVNALHIPGFAGGYACFWFDAPRGLKPKRRPEDQAGLRTRYNISA